MSKASVYRDVAIPAKFVRTIAAFTTQGATNIYGAALRQAAGSVGYPTGVLTITDPRSLAALNDHGVDVAEKVVSVSNRMLFNLLEQQPKDATDAELRAALAPLQESIASYNRDVLIPYTSAWAQEQAKRDFNTNNPDIIQTWIVEPGETDQDDICRDAIDMGEVDDATMASIEFPAHKRCPHFWTAASLDASNLPLIDDLWLGGEE